MVSGRCCIALRGQLLPAAGGLREQELPAAHASTARAWRIDAATQPSDAVGRPLPARARPVGGRRVEIKDEADCIQMRKDQKLRAELTIARKPFLTRIDDGLERPGGLSPGDSHRAALLWSRDAGGFGPKGLWTAAYRLPT